MSVVGDNDLSNWGRWGADDEQGTLNLITPQIIKAAVGLVKTGRVFSLAVPLATDGPQWPDRPKMWKVTMHADDPNRHGGSGDALMLHSHSGTHIDALCHIWYDHQLYNGFDASEHVTSAGVTRNSIDRVPAIVGRGLLLDIAGWQGVDHLEHGQAITVSDLDACAAAQGVEPQAGDILLIRTGWMRVFSSDRDLFDSGEPGIDTSTLPWLKQHDIAAVGADNHAVEVLTEIPPAQLPIHRAAIRDLGIYLIENLNLEELAAEHIYQFLMVIAPLPLGGGTGSPLNPLAIT